MTHRDWAATAVLALGVVTGGLAAGATRSFLKEYGDVCGETGVLTQVWVAGGGFGAFGFVVVLVVLAVAAALARRNRLRLAAALLVPAAAVAITIGGAAGLDAKKTIFEQDPATYGTCGGYNSGG